MLADDPSGRATRRCLRVRSQRGQRAYEVQGGRDDGQPSNGRVRPHRRESSAVQPLSQLSVVLGRQGGRPVSVAWAHGAAQTSGIRGSIRMVAQLAPAILKVAVLEESRRAVSQ